MRRRGDVLVAIVLLLCGAGSVPASAQSILPGRFEVGAGGGWWSDSTVGTVSAETTANRLPAGSSTELFETETSLASGPAADGWVAWWFTPAFGVEGRVALGWTDLQTEVRNDIEQAPDLTATAPFRQVTFEGGGVLRFGSAGGRVTPFVTGGGGYLRQLYEERVRIDSGATFYGGGGVRIRLGAPRPERLIEVIGLRSEARVVWRSGGIEVGGESSLRPHVTAGLGLFLGF